jgi:cytidine deaminase
VQDESRKEDQAAIAELIQRAKDLIAERQAEGRHHIGAAVRTASGRTFAAVNLEATMGRVAVCAEAVALGMAAAAGDPELLLVVAVDRKGEVVSPCGMCRELISDYAPSVRLIVPTSVGLMPVPVMHLLPNKTKRASEPPSPAQPQETATVETPNAC